MVVWSGPPACTARESMSIIAFSAVTCTLSVPRFPPLPLQLSLAEMGNSQVFVWRIESILLRPGCSPAAVPEPHQPGHGDTVSEPVDGDGPARLLYYLRSVPNSRCLVEHLVRSTGNTKENVWSHGDLNPERPRRIPSSIVKKRVSKNFVGRLSGTFGDLVALERRSSRLRFQGDSTRHNSFHVKLSLLLHDLGRGDLVDATRSSPRGPFRAAAAGTIGRGQGRPPRRLGGRR